MGVERLARDDGRRNGRDLVLGQGQGEGVLFQDGGIAPAPRSVELGDDGRGVIDADLIDAVLVAVQCEQAPIGQESDALHRIQHEIRGEVGIRCRVDCCHWPIIGV